MRILVALALSLLLFGQRSELDAFVVQEGGRLVATINGEERLLGHHVLRAWRGWSRNILLYTERLPDGRTQLNSFHSLNRLRRTMLTEAIDIVDITVAQMDVNRPVLVLFLKEDGLPGVALADPEHGVFWRERLATAGAIGATTVRIHHFTRDQFATEVDLQRLPPVRVSEVPLRYPEK